MLNLDFYSPREETFYTVVESKQAILNDAVRLAGAAIGGFTFNISPDTFSHERSVYTVLDWLGDVGGLRDALKLIVSALVAICSNGNLSSFLISKLFYKQKSKTTTVR